jgi:ATP-dependent exoDNAse (exonuclease V) beta subunit
LKYIINDSGLYLQEGNFYAEVGSFMHKILEMVLKGELKQEDALDYFIEHYDENVFYTTKDSVMDKSYEACAAYLRELDLSWLENCEVIGVEKKINTTLTDENDKEYSFIGFIDVAVRDKQDGEISIIDHKSATYPLKADGVTVLKRSEHSFQSYKRQLYLYAKAVHDKYGVFPKYLMWNHFKEQKIVVVEFDKEEYDAAMKWYIDKIHEIENDEDFVAKNDFFFCRNLCEFRDSCEYIDGEI